MRKELESPRAKAERKRCGLIEDIHYPGTPHLVSAAIQYAFTEDGKGRRARLSIAPMLWPGKKQGAKSPSLSNQQITWRLGAVMEPLQGHEDRVVEALKAHWEMQEEEVPPRCPYRRLWRVGKPAAEPITIELEDF